MFNLQSINQHAYTLCHMWCNKLTESMAPLTMPLNMEGQGQPTVIDCPTLKYNLFNLGGNHVSWEDA